MTNRRHTIKVTDGKETLVLTFSNFHAAWDAYAEMPKHLNASQPQRESHAVYSNASEALKTVNSFFREAAA